MKKSCTKYISLVTLVALLLSATLPFFATYNIQALAEEPTTESASLFGDKVLICTEDGFKWVSRSDIQNGKEMPAPHTRYQCALCYVATYGVKDAVSPQAAEVVYHEYTEPLSYNAVQLTVLDTYFVRGFHTRAPPFYA